MAAETIDELNAMVRPVMTWLSQCADLQDMQAKGNAFVAQFPPDRGLKIAAAMSYANPLYLPTVSDKMADDMKVGLTGFSIFAARAKMTAHRSPQTNIIVACAPKSASTFIHSALMRALKLPDACLFTATLDWASAARLGASLCEQEPDELALMRNGLSGQGYVAQHHSRCSPYLARLLGVYNVRPVITHRNIADTIVSMDDMVMEWRSNPQSAQYGFFNDAMPSNFEMLEREDRLMILAQRWTPWLVQFYLSWKKCERAGFAEPLWISYEQDFLGDKHILASRIADFVGGGKVDPDRLFDELSDKSDGKARRINKGVAGRGREMPESVLRQIRSAAKYYREEEDISALLEF